MTSIKVLYLIILLKFIISRGKRKKRLLMGKACWEGEQHCIMRNSLSCLPDSFILKSKILKALPLLQDYVNSSDKVSKEVLYELSYCYYKENRLDDAIAGFKQLSNERDSMGQNSMYLLGDLYLRTGQKVNARKRFSILCL